VTFTEIDLFGVYVAPMSLMMLAAWFITAVVRSIMGHLRLLRFTWHPALFLFSVYIIVLAGITVMRAR
jgi:hypothetical protein